MAQDLKARPDQPQAGVSKKVWGSGIIPYSAVFNQFNPIIAGLVIRQPSVLMCEATCAWAFTRTLPVAIVVPMR